MSEQPKWSDLLGMDPNYTHGMDTVRFLQHGRGECEEATPCALCLLDEAQQGLYKVRDTAQATQNELLDHIEWLVNQHCYEEYGVYDTGALSVNRDAFEILVKYGRAEYVGNQVGRRAFIKFKEE